MLFVEMKLAHKACFAIGTACALVFTNPLLTALGCLIQLYIMNYYSSKVLIVILATKEEKKGKVEQESSD